jgi:hypothetical protein
VEVDIITWNSFRGAQYSETPQDVKDFVNSVNSVNVPIITYAHKPSNNISIFRNRTADIFPKKKAKFRVHGQVLEGFWKVDPVGRRIQGPIRAFPLSVYP